MKLFKKLQELFTKKRASAVPVVLTSQDLVEDRYKQLQCSPTYHYLELYLESLPKNSCYLVQEKLVGGRVITHQSNTTTGLVFTYEDMASYCRSTFIESVPPKFVLTQVQPNFGEIVEQLLPKLIELKQLGYPIQ